MTKERLKPSDVYDSKKLAATLSRLGEYVYAYYEPTTKPVPPFYVGKGVNERCLDHWKRAMRGADENQPHLKKIAEILRSGRTPHIRFLAYELENSEEARNALVERVLQEAFGITKRWEKKDGADRLVEDDSHAVLLQSRRDSRSAPPLSIEAALCTYSDEAVLDLQEVCEQHQAPVLLVGLSKTYDESYQRDQVREMARMYWNITERTGEFMESSSAILLAWRSFGNPKVPRIVGSWRIKPKKATLHGDRYEFPASDDISLVRDFVGCSLPKSGLSYQGPRIVLPGRG